MAKLAQDIVLASASPRRQEILRRLGISARVVVSAIDESVGKGEDAATYVSRVAREKVEAARAAGVGFNEAIIGADTVVVVDGEILGKPCDDEDSARMLRKLSGREHEVLTCIAVFAGTLHELLVCTTVTFRALSEDEIVRYVEVGEGRDKAGAYAIQGIGSGLVRCISGSYDNVVGLPTAELLEQLRRANVLQEWP